jgi:hypothetical protein
MPGDRSATRYWEAHDVVDPVGCAGSDLPANSLAD